MKLVTVAEMRAIEKEANAKGLSYDAMMENAGQGLAEVVADYFRDRKEEGVLGLVGSGNNGGDTLVALTFLVSKGWMGSAYIVRPRLAGDPLMKRLEDAGGKIFKAEDDQDFEQLRALIANHALLLDGVLGTGIHLPLKKEVAVILDAAGRALESLEERPRVVAVDCPSGVDCDSGEAAVECIPADITVTMAAVKRGLLKFPAYELMGGLQVVSIGLPGDGEEMESWRSVKRIVPSRERIQDMLPWRPADAHKGTFGTALVIAGSINYTGAALLAGQAAYRIGAGLVTLAVPSPLHAALSGQFPEATWLLLPNELGVISSPAADVILKNLDRATAILAGPGFGMEDTTREFLTRLLRASAHSAHAGMGFVHAAEDKGQNKSGQLPALVVDADGLKLLAQIPDWPKRLPSTTVLTPHPGEMSVLTGVSIEDIQADRIATAEHYSQEWGHVVVLKGAFTVIAAPDGQAAVIPVATSALARAGTGDVLAGLIVGLRAQGLQAFPAAVAGAWIHAQAGLVAAQELGNTASVLASDVLRAVINVLSDVQGNPSG